jgi:hypothetical protein
MFNSLQKPNMVQKKANMVVKKQNSIIRSCKIIIMSWHCRQHFRNIRQPYRNMVKECSITLNPEAACSLKHWHSPNRTQKTTI